MDGGTGHIVRRTQRERLYGQNAPASLLGNGLSFNNPVATISQVQPDKRDLQALL
jgi:hypothetical protein